MNSLVKAWSKIVTAGRNRVALIEAESGRPYSFGEVAQRAMEMAATMPMTVRGCTVGLASGNSVDWIAAFLAVQLRGGALLPVDPHQPLMVQEKLWAHFAIAGKWVEGKWTARKKEKKNAVGISCWKLTSGTTGVPEGLPCQAGHLEADGENVCTTMGLRAGDRNLGLIPLGHSYGLGNLVLPLLIRGTSLVLAREFVPQQILPWMERYEVTVLPSVPAIYRLLAHLPGRGKPPTWRLAISAGAMLSPSIAQEFHQRFGLKLHNFYGSSETGGICYDRTGAATLSGRSVGKPLQGVTVSIGAGGKVKVRSRAVVTGRKASGACSRILEDLGEWTKQKELRLLGRAQPMANVAGRKVNPLEVEQLLRGMPGVNEAWVGVFQDRRGRDYLGAAVETEQAGPVVQRNLEKLLPTWKWPRAYTVKKILPRTERGKLDRVKLQQVLAKA